MKSRNLNILLCILPTFCTPVGVQCRFRLLSSSRQKIGYFVLLNRFPQCVMSALLGACNSHATRGICTDQSIFRYFSRQIGQFQSTWARFIADKTMRPHLNISTSCRHVNISPCSWLQLVTEVPVGIWIQGKFKLKIDQSVKTPWQEYRVVAGSLWWAPAYTHCNTCTTDRSGATCIIGDNQYHCLFFSPCNWNEKSTVTISRKNLSDVFW